MAKKRGAGSIGERIVEARLAYGSRRRKSLTQAELAKMLGVTPGTVSQWESDTTKPSHDVYPVLAVKLGVAPEWLAWGLEIDEGEDFPQAAAKRKGGSSGAA